MTIKHFFQFSTLFYRSHNSFLGTVTFHYNVSSPPIFKGINSPIRLDHYWGFIVFYSCYVQITKRTIQVTPKKFHAYLFIRGGVVGVPLIRRSLFNGIRTRWRWGESPTSGVTLGSRSPRSTGKEGRSTEWKGNLHHEVLHGVEQTTNVKLSKSQTKSVNVGGGESGRYRKKRSWVDFRWPPRGWCEFGEKSSYLKCTTYRGTSSVTFILPSLGCRVLVLLKKIKFCEPT